MNLRELVALFATLYALPVAEVVTGKHWMQREEF